MVKKLVIALFLTWSGTVLSALQPSLEDMGESFSGRSIEIIWEAPTNKLPTTLSVFKASARIFPAEVISNLIALAEFKEPGKALAALKPALQGKSVSFQEKKPLQGVSISPQNGCIDYSNSRAQALPREAVEDVPTKEQTLELGLKLLPKLGIEASELARQPDGSGLQLSHILGEQGQLRNPREKKTILQGVIFTRAVDGIAFNGLGTCAGVSVSFGNHAKIAELQVAWRNLTLDRKVPVASPAQIIQWVRDGKAVIDTGLAIVPFQIKKLTITRITPYYLGKDAFEVQKVVYPYAMLTATADTGFTNSVVRLSCPIFK